MTIYWTWAESCWQGVCFVCSIVPWTGNMGMWIDGPSQSHLQWPGGFYRDSCRQRWRQCRLNRRATSLRRGQRVRNSNETGVSYLRKGEEAFFYQTHGSPEGRCRWPSQCLWWSPHWPAVYTLMGSLRTLLPNIEMHKICMKSLGHGSRDIKLFKKIIKWKKKNSKTLTVENLIVSWIWYQILGVHWPVQVGDEARMTLGCDTNSLG